MSATPLGLLLLLGFAAASFAQSPPALPPAEAPSYTTDKPETRSVVAVERLGIPSEIATALAEILAVEAELVRLGMPPLKDGVPIEDEATYAKRIYQEGSAFLQYLEPKVQTFDFHVDTLPSIQLVIDSVVFDAGYRAAAKLLHGRPDFQASALLALFHDGVVRGESILGTELAAFFHKGEVASGALAPLGNGKALAVLTWGFLYQDAYWADETNDREEFLAQLLSHGFDSRYVAAAVRMALEPPLMPPRKELAKEKTGHAIAGPLVELRGKVGFTKVHEQQLMADLRLVQEIQKLPGHDEELDLRDFTLEEVPGVGLRKRLTQRGHIKVWLPKMLDLVRSELYPGDYTLLLRHGESIEERTLFWNQIFGRHGYFAGRDAALLEIKAIFADQDEHPLTPRIQELLDKQMADELTAVESEELAQLERTRGLDRKRTIGLMANLIASYGTSTQYEDMLETMSRTLPEALEPMAARDRDGLLYQAWGASAIQPTPQVVKDLEDYFRGDSILPPMAAERFLYFVGPRDYPGGRALLERVFEQGTESEISACIANSAWMDHTTLERATGALLAKYDSPDCGALARSRITSGVLLAIINQKDPKQAKADLLATIDEGRWNDPSSSKYWGTYLWKEGAELEKLRGLLTASEIQALIDSGKLAKGLL